VAIQLSHLSAVLSCRRLRLIGTAENAAHGPWLWKRGGHISNRPRNSWIKGLASGSYPPYGDSGAHGGAARSVTGSDTGGNTRLDTRPTTRPVTVTSQARESARDRARDSPPDHSPERTREFLRRRCFVARNFGYGRRAHRGDPPPRHRGAAGALFSHLRGSAGGRRQPLGEPPELDGPAHVPRVVLRIVRVELVAPVRPRRRRLPGAELCVGDPPEI
jgi:hypothetical protein